VEVIGSFVEIFHSLSWLVIAVLIVLTLIVSAVMIGICRGDFENAQWK